ncbi:adenylyltransferase/cytidyltransferase family protein [Curvibacter sp. CHRR-16]|uniref:adenylyltransferase/cytidyltransferase family protein n=1 Tax=Curvibacter sp. CHRR-16 TaxID=2835872 RepID=UPI001BDA3A70|nr:adenylyltransferase/cytidyltransferase family protein [Curvibacter sp. CHRR-16]MBT0570579.1 adenylyltransferase/cytidyltransferase family protein [Curvibacter sp. CHRR-16]
MQAPSDITVFIGRFQPFHNGHLCIVRQALGMAQRVVMVLGSSYASSSRKNPFSWQERAALVQQALSPAERARVDFLPLHDYRDDSQWVQAVRAGVHQLAQQQLGLNVPRVALIGHFKDDSSYYLRYFHEWKLVSVPRNSPIDASHIRNAWLASTMENMPATLAAFADDAPASTLQFLLDWSRTPAFAALQQQAL